MGAQGLVVVIVPVSAACAPGTGRGHLPPRRLGRSGPDTGAAVLGCGARSCTTSCSVQWRAWRAREAAGTCRFGFPRRSGRLWPAAVCAAEGGYWTHLGSVGVWVAWSSGFCSPPLTACVHICICTSVRVCILWHDASIQLEHSAGLGRAGNKAWSRRNKTPWGCQRCAPRVLVILESPLLRGP